MRNHIVIKFIAVLLCAASLLGAVGSGIGIFALTSMDLYDKTVEQVYQERIESQGRSFANELAMEFTSKNLGGFTNDMLESVTGMATGYYRHDFEPNYFGYTLKNYEGNVLDSQVLNYPEGAVTYTYDITGQYMYLVDVIPESERIRQQTAIAAAAVGAEGVVLYDVIPPEGAAVGRLQITLMNGVGYYDVEEDLGVAFYNADGILQFHCVPWAMDADREGETVEEIVLSGRNGETLYHACAPTGVGQVQWINSGSTLLFTSSYSREPAAVEDVVVIPATEPTMEETVPMTTAPAETVPESTALEETAPAETGEAAAPAEAEEPAQAAEAQDDSAEADKSKEEKQAAEGDKPKEEQQTAEGDKPKEDKQDTAESDKPKEETVSADAAAVAAPAEGAEAEPATEGTEVTEAPTETTVPETVPEETVTEETIPEETEPLMINGKSLDSYQINRTEYYDSQLGETATAKYIYVPMPAMTVELYIAPGALRYEAVYTLLGMVRNIRGYLLPAIGICLLLFAVCAVYLCCAAGRKPRSEEICAGGLNRMPLDLYGFLMVMGIGCICAFIAEGGYYVLRQNIMVGVAFMAALGYLACLLFVGCCFAFVAQIKMKEGFWWRNSLCGWGLKLCVWAGKKLLQLCVVLEEWLAAKGLPALKKLLLWIWGLVTSVLRWFWNLLVRCCHAVYNGFNRFLSLLPVTWQWILIGSAMVLLLFITVAARFDFGMVLSILLAFALILYGAHCFGMLQEATRKMNKGDLSSKADDKLMVGAFKDFAHDLNDLADVAVVAAQKQLKSERMKTELITNVSHDIKTPLTSIINYVDLLQKPHTEEEGQEYLEVLDRQSQRLKKLIEDLMDMSKASTGNMAVDITTVDAVESVNQALGEFADKLEKVQVTPVFRHGEASVPMLADGRLVWRVLSNLLGNAVKYAMPGTRLYIDLMSLEDKVVISLKNISRDELNVDAEELMERFVRGDDSRNTEGSGLGLNIAKSLMELQKGQLQLLVDGDLFKVTLIFPGA